LLAHRYPPTGILGRITVLASALGAALGAAFGSFLGLCLDRIPQRESIVRPGSRCGACRTPLRAIDLVPVLSYLERRGRCRYCGAAIGLPVFGIELGAAAAFAGLPLWLGAGTGVLAALAIVAAGVATALMAERAVRS
jgi:leader peptidase (prepilin peptidase)/N-methyltransferase